MHNLFFYLQQSPSFQSVAIIQSVFGCVLGLLTIGTWECASIILEIVHAWTVFSHFPQENSSSNSRKDAILGLFDTVSRKMIMHAHADSVLHGIFFLFACLIKILIDVIHIWLDSHDFVVISLIWTGATLSILSHGMAWYSIEQFPVSVQGYMVC